MRWLGLVWLAVGCGIPDLPDVAEPCGEWPEPGTYQVKIDMPDKTRKAIVEIGATSGPRDLIVALHGGTSSAAAFSEVTRFGDLTATLPLVAVFPQGRKTWFWRMWNVGPCCGTIDDEHRGADDVAFLDALVKELSPKVCADKVLAVGFSNGSMMANRWACESDIPDAVVAAAGPLLEGKCPGSPLPYRAYHGVQDDKVAIEGGESSGGRNLWPPASETWDIWRARNECSEDNAESFTFGQMTCTRYDCAAPTEVCVLEGWGHAWPGGRNAGGLEGSNATTDVIKFLDYSTSDDDVPQEEAPVETP